MRLNIHIKITLILTATVAIIFSAVYAYLNLNLRDYTLQRIKSNLSKQVDFAVIHLEKTYQPYLSLEESDILTNQIGESLNLRATIIDLEGRVLGDSELSLQQLRSVENHLSRPEVQQALKNDFGESHRYSTTVHKEMLYMARPFGMYATQGVIRLSIPLSEINLISEKLRSLLLVALFFAFLFTILIGSTAFIFVSKPIREISSVAQELARGHYSKRVSVSSNDEIGDLGRAINFMSQQINTKIEEVISNKSRFEAVLLSMCEGTMVVDRKGTILLMNDVLSKFFQVNDDPLGRKPLEVIRNIEIQEITDNVLQSQSAVLSQEISILTPEEKTFQVYAAPVLHGKELDGAVLVFHDITELRRLESVRRDFVANVSHEIRTPLTNIKGYAETLLDGAINDKKNALDFLKIVCSDSNRLVQLVDDLLELSKIESGKFNLRIASHAIEDIIDRVLVGLKEQAIKDGIELHKDVPPDLPHVNVDDASIAQVLLNLLNNAIKYNLKGGAVTISARDEGSFIRVDVSDTGIGIPEEDLPRIFERFYRVDKARSRELGGTGLGLSIVKHIVQAHQGDISVESVLEKGTTFSFTLPKAKSA